MVNKGTKYHFILLNDNLDYIGIQFKLLGIPLVSNKSSERLTGFFTSAEFLNSPDSEQYHSQF